MFGVKVTEVSWLTCSELTMNAVRKSELVWSPFGVLFHVPLSGLIEELEICSTLLQRGSLKSLMANAKIWSW